MEALSAMGFCGMSLEGAVPDHSTLGRFASELTDKRAYDRLLEKINLLLSKHKLMVKTGHAMVDVSLTAHPISPAGNKTYSEEKEGQN